jgi:osmotically-inducible protein OsmY
MGQSFSRVSGTAPIRAAEGLPGSDPGVAEGDVDIRLAVLNALHWDLAVPRDRLQVKVESGWVTLRGDVDREYSKTSAEAHARSVAGVSGVTNAISVKV